MAHTAGLAGGDHEFLLLLRIPGAQIAEAEAVITFGRLTHAAQADQNLPPGTYLQQHVVAGNLGSGWLEIVGEANSTFRRLASRLYGVSVSHFSLGSDQFPIR